MRTAVVLTSFGKPQRLVDVPHGTDQGSLHRLAEEGQATGVEVDVECTRGRETDTSTGFSSAVFRGRFAGSQGGGATYHITMPPTRGPR